MPIKREWKIEQTEDKSEEFRVAYVSQHYGDVIRLNGYGNQTYKTLEEAEKYVKDLKWAGDVVIFSFRRYKIGKQIVVEKGTPKKKYAVFYKQYVWRKPFKYTYCGVVEGYDVQDASKKIKSYHGYKSGAKFLVLNEKGHLKNPMKVIEWAGENMIYEQWNDKNNNYLKGDLEETPLVKLFSPEFERTKKALDEISFKDIMTEVLKNE